LVEGQTQSGEQEDDLFAIPPLEEEDVLIDVLREGDGANEDPLSFGLNLKDLYHLFKFRLSHLGVLCLGLGSWYLIILYFV